MSIRYKVLEWNFKCAGRKHLRNKCKQAFSIRWFYIKKKKPSVITEPWPRIGVTIPTDSPDWSHQGYMRSVIITTSQDFLWWRLTFQKWKMFLNFHQMLKACLNLWGTKLTVKLYKELKNWLPIFSKWGLFSALLSKNMNVTKMSVIMFMNILKHRSSSMCVWGPGLQLSQTNGCSEIMRCKE